MTGSKTAKGRIIVFGILFWYPLAGVTYQFLHYLIGLRRLGYDPFYIEDSSRWGVYDPEHNDITTDPTNNICRVLPILERHGFGHNWAFRSHETGECFGKTQEEIRRVYREADAFLNVTGAQEVREEHLDCPRRIYVESDPFGSQVRAVHNESRMLSILDSHDTLFTFGENVGAEDCAVPTAGYEWLPTRQPVVLDLWQNILDAAPDAAFNTITTWHDQSKDLEYQGETYYWTKHREFLKFIDLPRKRSVPFEMAVGPDEKAHAILDEHGWRRANALRLSQHVDTYRDYIRASRGEFTVARDQYVRPRTGWFSDRSACYLAAARPVIAQQTGFNTYLPTGEGLFAFTEIEDILAAVDAIESDPARHRRAAREIAAEYFAADHVIGSLLDRAGL